MGWYWKRGVGPWVSEESIALSKANYAGLPNKYPTHRKLFSIQNNKELQAAE